MATTLDKLYLLSIPEIQEAFLGAMAAVVDRAIIVEMEEAIKNNDIEALYSASGFSPAVLAPILDRIESVYKQSAEYQVGLWPNTVNTPFGKRHPIFNIRNLTVENELKNHASEFIKDVETSVRTAITDTLVDGQMRGINPRSTALNIVGRINPLTKKREGGVIGLTANQVKWSVSARIYLENLDEKYLELGLRDKRFDSVVQKAIKEGKKLNTDTIDKLINAYNQKALKWRANNIAITESSSAMSRGAYGAILQGFDEGYFTKEQVTKWWDDSHDGRTRLDHVALGVKYSRDKAIPFDQPFESARGFSMNYPTDRSLGASANQIVHCRCRLGLNVNFGKK